MKEVRKRKFVLQTRANATERRMLKTLARLEGLSVSGMLRELIRAAAQERGLLLLLPPVEDNGGGDE